MRPTRIYISVTWDGIPIQATTNGIVASRWRKAGAKIVEMVNQ